MDSIRARFRYARRLRGMTQREVALHHDVDTGTVYRWESGVLPISLATCESAASLFAVSRAWLAFGEGVAPAAMPSDRPAPAEDDDEPREGAA